MKKRILILSLLVFIISIGCVSASDNLNATDTLALDDNAQNTLNLDENSQDDVVSASSFTGNFNELQNIINKANNGATIYLSKDYKGSGEIDIFKDITIDGKGHTIDASGKSRIFFADGDNYVILKNINFKNGYTDIDGGAVTSITPTTQIINCKFIGNTASSGGAISSYFNTLIQGCTFQNNKATAYGGAIYADKLIVRSSTFTDNTAKDGGSLSASDLEVLDSSFSSKAKGDFIDFSYYKVTGNKLFLENNVMKGAGPFDITYSAHDPITSKVNFNFLDNTVKKGQSVQIVKITDDMGNTIEMDSLIDVQITDKNGKVVNTFTLRSTNGYKYTCNLNDGTYTVSAKIPSSVAVNAKVRKGTLTVSSNTVQLKASDVTKYYKGSQKYSVTVTNNGKAVSGASVSITINGKTTNVKTDKNGVATLALNQASGTYQITSSYGGKKVTTKVTIKPTITGKDASGTTQSTKYSVTVLNSDGTPLKKTKISFKIGSTSYSATTNDKGVATLDLKLKAGTYNIEATNPKTSEKIKNKISVRNPPTIKIQAKDFTKYYGGTEKFTVKITDAKGNALANKEVKITLNGKTYKRTTDKSGIASMNIGLNSNVYPTTVECGGEKVNVKITVKATVSGKDVTKMYKNGTQYYATFVDSKGNLLKNTEVQFNINGVFYKRTTDSKGVAKMNINLIPNTYIITAKNPKTNEMFTNKITVNPTIVENNDLTKYYKNSSRYSFRILGNDGKPVGKGVNVEMNINGVIYKRQTDANGYVRMVINLPPGTYTVTASYNGLKASNTIKVLSILYAKDMYKDRLDDQKYSVKLVNGLGKPYPGEYVRITCTYKDDYTDEIVDYDREVKTDENGIATPTKLYWSEGSYIITASYNGLSISNRVTIVDTSTKLVP